MTVYKAQGEWLDLVSGLALDDLPCNSSTVAYAVEVALAYRHEAEMWKALFEEATAEANDERDLLRSRAPERMTSCPSATRTSSRSVTGAMAPAGPGGATAHAQTVMRGAICAPSAVPSAASRWATPDAGGSGSVVLPTGGAPLGSASTPFAEPAQSGREGP